MRRAVFSALIVLGLVLSGCNRAPSPDPNERERELQKHAREQHEAEEKAAKAKSTDNASAIKKYKGPDTAAKPQPKKE